METAENVVLASHTARHQSKTAEHFTPTGIIEAARAVMGGIDLDPASTRKANAELVKAKKYFDKAQNGLSRAWMGKVFLNPPGGKIDGKSLAVAFWQKLLTEFTLGNTTEAIFLGFSLEILQSAQRCTHSPLDFPICIPRRRLAFLQETEGGYVPQTSPTHANVITCLTVEPAQASLFGQVFSAFGAVKL